MRARLHPIKQVEHRLIGDLSEVTPRLINTLSAYHKFRSGPLDLFPHHFADRFEVFRTEGHVCSGVDVLGDQDVVGDEYKFVASLQTSQPLPTNFF